MGDKLGEGAFSVVKLATHKQTGEKVAIKCIDRRGLAKDDEDALRQEVSIMKTLNHENIVKFFDFFEEPKYFYVVLEFVEGGELFDRIVTKTFYNEKEARDVVLTVLNGIKYCHDKGIAHRDLKPENLLLTSKQDDCFVKIADFGFAIRGAEKNALKTQCGTPGYVAPEILQNQPYDRAVDMWSIGVITYVLLGGYPPFHEDNEHMLFKKIKKGKFEFHEEYWAHISQEAKDFISSLIKVNSKERLTVEGALGHPWLQRDAKELEGHNLGTNLEALKKYQKNKKFRAAANAVIAVNRIGNMLGNSKSSETSAAATTPNV